MVRINSQSGKGGIAFILEKDHGLSLPRRLQINLSEKVQAVADQTGKEVISSEIWHVFEEQYLQVSGKFKLDNYSLSSSEDTAGIASDNIEITLSIEGEPLIIYGTGGGPIEAFVSAINSHINESISVSDYHQHSVTSGSDAKAAAYIELTLRAPDEGAVDLARACLPFVEMGTASFPVQRVLN